MTIGKASDFQIYDLEYQSGMIEVLAQRLLGFNAAVNGGIILSTEQIIGAYEKAAFFASTSGLISRRDTTSVAAIADIAITQGEFVGVKRNRTIGPVAQTLDAWKKIGKTTAEQSRVFGQQVGKAKALDYMNQAISAAKAAIIGQTNLFNDISDQSSSAGAISAQALVDTLALFGDRAQDIVILVAHSASYFGLITKALGAKLFEEAGMVVYGGAPGTLGKPIVITDSPDLVGDAVSGYAGYPYYTLGLVAGASVLKESEPETIVTDTVTGLANLVYRVQGEYAFNQSVKGFKWDTTNGGENPTDADVGTSTNWDKEATDDKDLAGVALLAFSGDRTAS